MTNEINILHLEDDSVDANLVELKLEAAEIPCRITHVQTREEFERELRTGSYDLILADYNLPTYDGISALRYKLSICSDVPFIFVSGTIGEEAAIDGMVEGATDYVLKQKLSRLAPAVKRAISESIAIRKRKQAEEALRVSEHRKTILNNIASIFLSVPDDDVNGEILSLLIELTRSRVGSFGYLEGNGDLKVPNYSKGIWGNSQSPSEATVIPAYLWSNSVIGKAIESKRTSTFNDPADMPATNVSLASLIVVPILFGNKVIGVLCFGRDDRGYTEEDQSILEECAKFISPILNVRMQRDRLERVRRLAELELIAAKEKAEEGDRLKTAFLQNVSHEIRTPMNAICGFSYFLNEADLSNAQRKQYVDIIQSNCKQLLSVVTDVLTLSSLETRQMEVNLENVCVNKLFAELLAMFQEQASQRGIRLIAAQIQECDRLVVSADKGKLTQILTNLISNAIKFTREGFVEFGYELKLDEAHPVVEFYVKDTGMGVAEELREVIFERFRQATKKIQIEYGGMGLGLSISKGLVELLGGEIWLQSEPGKGSTFYFSIPYLPEVQPDVARDALPKLETKNAKKILVVEDKEYNYLYLKELLSRMDRDSVHARDGQEAISICKVDHKIGLVLMDIKMPRMDGRAAARIIKENRPDLPIVAQSAYAADFEDGSYRSVFDDFLLKPLDRVDMMRVISRY